MSLFTSSAKTELENSKRVTEACDQVISEIGAELHDDLVQKLSVFRLLIDRLERSYADQNEVESIAIKMSSEFEQVIVAVRNISRQFLPAPVDSDSFVDRLEFLCQNMQSVGITHIHFQSDGIQLELSDSIEKHLYRIIQELIHNAFKHSAAWHIWVRLIWEEKKITLEVEDDGTGFSKIPEFVERLKRKYNTLKMRTSVIGASIIYLHGNKGLLAKIELAL